MQIVLIIVSVEHMPLIIFSKLPFGMYSWTMKQSDSSAANCLFECLATWPYPRSLTILLCSSFETILSSSHMLSVEWQDETGSFLMATSSLSRSTP